MNERDGLQWTALHHAAIAGTVEAAGLLLDRGADPNARDDLEHTPLHWAALKGRAEMCGLLARRGARTDARDVYGMTALHVAADDRTVTALVNAGAEVNALDKRGATPLHVARQGIVARALMDRGADVRMRDPLGRTPMQIAAVDSLLKQGVAVRGPMLARLRGLISQTVITVMNISERPLPRVVVTAHSPAASVDVSPPQIDPLQPGELMDFILTMTRTPGVPEGEHPLFVALATGAQNLGELDFRVHTSMTEIPEDRGAIRLAKGSLRPAPTRAHYLVYVAPPLLLAAAILLVRSRRRR